MKKSLMLAALALVTTLGMNNTAEAQWGRYGGGRGLSISIGSGRSGFTYSRGYGYRAPLYGYGYSRGGLGYGRGVVVAPRYYGGYGGGYYRGGGGYYGGRSYYGRGYCR